MPEAATRAVLYIDFLTNFAKFTGKHLCQSLFFNKVADLGPTIPPVAADYRTPPVAASTMPKNISSRSLTQSVFTSTNLATSTTETLE